MGCVSSVIAEDANTKIGYLAGAPKEIDYRNSKYFEIENMGVVPEGQSLSFLA